MRLLTSRSMASRVRSGSLTGYIDPCVPRPAKEPPAGLGWLHEIKHDGFHILARRENGRVRLITRNGNDFTARFPQIATAVGALPARSCLIDGEDIVTDDRGLAVFELVRRQQHHGLAELCAFDLIELDGEDLRRQAIEHRKAALAQLLRRSLPGIVLNEHFEGDGAIIFRQACALGCEGIVSKRLGSPYRSGRTNIWVKVKNPSAPAATRELEEDWSNR